MSVFPGSGEFPAVVAGKLRDLSYTDSIVGDQPPAVTITGLPLRANVTVPLQAIPFRISGKYSIYGAGLQFPQRAPLRHLALLIALGIADAAASIGLGALIVTRLARPFRASRQLEVMT